MKNVQLSLVFLGLMLMVSCQDVNTVPKPENLIGKEKMTDILYDLTLVDAAVSINRNVFSDKNFKAKQYIYKKYGVDSAQVVSSNAYYMQHIKLNMKMYKEIRKRLKEHKREINRKKDSLIKAKESAREKKQEVESKKVDSVG